MTARIEVPGKFVFCGGDVEFVFGNVDNPDTMQFHRVTNMDELRAAFVGIATCGTQTSINSVLGDGAAAGASAPNQTETRRTAAEALLARTERSFQEFQRKTEDALRKAQEDYEAATANLIDPTGATAVPGGK